jgi:hypothetical protein
VTGKATTLIAWAFFVCAMLHRQLRHDFLPHGCAPAYVVGCRPLANICAVGFASASRHVELTDEMHKITDILPPNAYEGEYQSFC